MLEITWTLVECEEDEERRRAVEIRCGADPAALQAHGGLWNVPKWDYE